MSDTASGPLTEKVLAREAASRRRTKLIVIGGVVVVLVLIAVGVAVGVTVSNNNKSKNLSSSSTSSSDPKSGDTTSRPGNNNDPNDPSVFTKDPNLHKSFYGMAYTPEGSLLPNCGNSLQNVIKDIQASHSFIHLKGGTVERPLVAFPLFSLDNIKLEAIKQTKVDMQVYVGNYVLPDDSISYTRQRDTLKDAIQTYGVDHIAGMTVGNEFMLNYLSGRGQTDPNSATGNEGASQLLSYINDTRQMLAGLSLSKNIPVGNSDAGSYFNTEVLSAVDYGLSNVHAWFANTTAEGAASWVTTFFEDTNVKPAALLPNKPKMYIAETGWPTKSSDAGNASNGAGTASISGLQTFLDTFVCQANSNNIPYFYFEFFDEKWKDIQFGGVEGWWGLFNAE
ncbi:hypothetical protein H0H87_001677 [Tephrocybe sp. NHM501043]|nr:hypothetical protein H0H87_001677 [Tephrocybe sp. NHM501043]